MFRWKRRPPPADPQPSPPPIQDPTPAADALFEAQRRIWGRDDALTVVDAGAHHGHTTAQYLDAFPNCRVIALEPASANHAVAITALAPYGARVELLRVGLSDTNSKADLRLTSHSGAHSLLEVGDMRFYDEPVDILPPELIETVTLDRLCEDRGIDTLDILKMDIQGGELMALKGAETMLARGAIRLIVLEVLFQALYKDQPMFWDLADYLRAHKYALQGIYQPRHHDQNHALLCWADAIFAAPGMTAIPGDSV
jgi:FkbM family methyltransferase